MAASLKQETEAQLPTPATVGEASGGGALVPATGGGDGGGAGGNQGEDGAKEGNGVGFFHT